MSIQTDRFLRYPIRSNKFSYSIEVERVVHSEQTAFQKIDIYDTVCFGRLLTLDGHVQLSDLDEALYHECLVHVPLLNVPSPRRALVVGGGDGGVLRELVKHSSLEQIDMVEIDERVVAVAKEHLPRLSNGAFDDPRVNLHIADAFKFLKEAPAGHYDLIVMDITDTYEEEDGELSEQLFTEDFHNDLRNTLSEQGILVSQADNPTFCPYSMEGLLKTLRAIFPQTGWYQTLVPSFGGLSAYVWASKGTTVSTSYPLDRAAGVDLRALNEDQYRFALSGLTFTLPG